jgi:hypothetical protein
MYNIHMNKKYYKKYNRPKYTLTDMAQKNFDEFLNDFIEIDYEELFELDRNTNIRYISFDIKNNRELFRFGGDLQKAFNDYVVLKGRRCTFCAQRYIKNNNEIIYQTRFFKKYKKYKDKKIIT